MMPTDHVRTRHTEDRESISRRAPEVGNTSAARTWQARGRRFESAMLHSKIKFKNQHGRSNRNGFFIGRALPQMRDGLAHGDGHETLAVVSLGGRGAGWILMVPKACLRCCLGARPVVLSVAGPFGMSTWGKIVFAPRFAATAIAVARSARHGHRSPAVLWAGHPQKDRRRMRVLESARRIRGSACAYLRNDDGGSAGTARLASQSRSQ